MRTRKTTGRLPGPPSRFSPDVPVPAVTSHKGIGKGTAKARGTLGQCAQKSTGPSKDQTAQMNAHLGTVATPAAPTNPSTGAAAAASAVSPASPGASTASSSGSPIPADHGARATAVWNELRRDDFVAKMHRPRLYTVVKQSGTTLHLRNAEGHEFTVSATDVLPIGKVRMTRPVTSAEMDVVVRTKLTTACYMEFIKENGELRHMYAQIEDVKGTTVLMRDLMLKPGTFRSCVIGRVCRVVLDTGMHYRLDAQGVRTIFDRLHASGKI